jgi:hypothetical protein
MGETFGEYGHPRQSGRGQWPSVIGDAFPAWRKKIKSGKLARTRRWLEQADALLATV